MKETIKRLMKENGLGYKDYIMAYIIAYVITGGILKQVIYSPIHMLMIINAISMISIRAVYKQNVITTWESRGIFIRVFIKHMPIIIILCLAKLILNIIGINTEFILGA